MSTNPTRTEELKMLDTDTLIDLLSKHTESYTQLLSELNYGDEFDYEREMVIRLQNVLLDRFVGGNPEKEEPTK